ncbi:MAG: PQQ-binding-like beta-propeller repeat protein [Bryobacteraceae bacterium]|nr:PQQ-binding-like beta-propeller repeat protein [Bryobacteraceae bacterium]
MKRFCFAAATAAALLTLSAEPLPDVWPGWRGPLGDGTSPLKGLPVEWSPENNLAWKAPVPGRGHSSPVIWKDRVFLTSDIEGEVIPGAGPVKHKINNEPFVHPDSVSGNRKHTLKVLAFDVSTGKLLWERTAYEGKVYDDIHKFNTYASPTPVTDGKHLYVWFESQGLYKYDFTGKLLWSANLGGIATLGVGTGVSPVLFEDLALLLCDQDGGENSFLAAVSTKTGKEVWRTKRTNGLTWTTPLLVPGPQLIVPSSEDVTAYHPRTGKELWRAEGLENNVVHTPVAGHGMVYVSSGYPNKKTMAIRLQPRTGEERVAWRYAKGTGYLPSPLIYGDYIYLMTGAGLFTCLDARTGEPKYESKRFPAPGQFTASPVAFDGKILITSNDGDTYVVKAGPEFEVLGKNALGEAVYASLAMAGDSIFVRSAGHLYRIRKTADR